MASRRAPVIADVARLAEVSVPTVSRVLTGSIPVSDEKRRRVEAAIAELNYRPSATARALASRSESFVAVLTSDTSKYGYAETIRGIEVAARERGYAVTIVVVPSEQDEDVDSAAASTLSQPVAGAVVLTFDTVGEKVAAALDGKLPFVVLSGAPDPRHPQAAMEERSSARALTTLLLEWGHRTVTHVRIPISGREDGRTEGWREALHAVGAPIPSVVEADWDPMGAVAIGRRLAADPEVTAVFCGNDEIAMGVIRGLGDAGRRVPEDVSVAGFDDHPIAAVFRPSLTTARQEFASLGSRGLGQLLVLIDGDAPEQLTLETPEVIVRESTGPAPGSGAVTDGSGAFRGPAEPQIRP